MTTTCIRKADWVVRWNPDREQHEYLRDADVVFQDDRVTHVGPDFAEPVDEEMDGSRLMVMPGLVNIHSHPTNQPITRAIREEIANPALYMTSLYDRTGLWRISEDALQAGAVVAYGELLKSGVTTVVDYAARPPDGWIDLMAQSGLRVVAAPSFRDASWSVADESRVEYLWAPEEGKRQFEGSMDLIDAAMAHPSGRLSGMVLNEGLAIVNSLAKLHDAKLTVDSVVGSGTTVTLKFPQAAVTAGPDDTWSRTMAM